MIDKNFPISDGHTRQGNSSVLQKKSPKKCKQTQCEHREKWLPNCFNCFQWIFLKRIFPGAGVQLTIDIDGG